MAATAGFAAVGLTTSYLAGEGMKTQANYNKRIANANAEMAEFAADEAIKKSEKTVEAYRRKVKQVVGSQIASAANAGIAVNTGTISDLQTETEIFAAEDIKTIRNNAFLESMGLKSQALNYRFEGEAGMAAAERNANTGMLTGTITGAMQGFMSKGGSGSGGSSGPSSGSTYKSNITNSTQSMDGGTGFIGANTKFSFS